MIIESIRKQHGNHRFLIIGFSKLTGLSTSNFLHELHIQHDVFDERKDVVELLPSHLSMENVLCDATSVDFGRYDVFILSPGFPRSHVLIQRAQTEGKVLYGDVDFIFPYLKDKVTVGITGTDGKTTTTWVTEKLLSASFSVVSCGNNEKPIFSELRNIEKSEVVVVELSSYMLENHHHIHPRYAVITNVAEDHLERYKDMNEYYETKLSLLKNMTEKDVLVWNVDDERLKKEKKIQHGIFQKKSISVVQKADFFFDGSDFQMEGHRLSYGDTLFQGIHNASNWLCALSIARHLGMSFETIEKAMPTITPLKYRMEPIKVNKTWRVFNDSKSTTCQATLKAVMSFEKGVVLMMGGKSKGIRYVDLNSCRSRMRKVFTYGVDGLTINADLYDIGEVEYISDFRQCVEKAWASLKDDEVFLFSPGCASYDQFEGYAHRGRVFDEMIKKLDGQEI